jgi:hypothetical protein
MTTDATTPQRLIDALPTTITIDGLEYRVGYEMRLATTYELVVTGYKTTIVHDLDLEAPLEQELQRIVEKTAQRMKSQLPDSVEKHARRITATHRELAAWNSGEKITKLHALRNLFTNEEEGDEDGE